MAWGASFQTGIMWYWVWTIILLQELTSRAQQSVPNGQSSPWEVVKFSVSQDSLLGLLLILIYINDLSDGLISTCKIFADDTSLFFFVHDKYVSRDELISDLKK